MAHQLILVLDFGSQYTQLIARRIREQAVYCEIHPFTLAKDPERRQIRAAKPTGIVLSGGPSSVYGPDAPTPPPALFDLGQLGVPILGICYGAQLAAHLLGGDVQPADRREYGRATVKIKQAHAVCRTMHTAESDNGRFSGFANAAKRIHCVQFHPEVVHTPRGAELLTNWLFGVCGAAGDWSMASFVDESVARIRGQVGAHGRVICGLSGGVDSSVAAALLHRAIGERLTCIFVDNGLLRRGEREQVAALFRDHFKVDLRVIEAEQRFLDALAEVTDPERKRKIIGHEFISVFDDEARTISGVEFLAQGTLYPDERIEEAL